MNGKSTIVNSIISGRFPKYRYPIFCSSLVDKKFICTIISFDVPGITDIYIQQLISVNINHGNTRGPFTSAVYPCFFRNVFEPETALIKE
jgi:hypothetical protein